MSSNWTNSALTSTARPGSGWGIRPRRDRSKGGPVGTEAAALKNVKANAKYFSYPEGGFENRIEYSLLYNMISEPLVYPEDVVVTHIDDEDFDSYIITAETPSSSKAEDSNNEVSYAQLSAILALSAEKYPPRDGKEAASVSQKLAKCVLQTVIRYAEEHDLDRQAEIQELIGPVEKHAETRNSQADLETLIPMYLGYAATLVVANPLPMLVVAGVVGGRLNTQYKENVNALELRQETKRRADVETTSLLDEMS